MPDCVHACDHFSGGVAVNQFIARVFTDCVYGPRDMAGFLVGMSSLAFWICCQAPQFYKNIKRGSVDALSPWFLFEWFSGDLLNIVGSILSKQQTTQLATAFLFVMMDIIMLSQYIYYTGKNKRRQRLVALQEGSLLPGVVIAATLSTLPQVAEAAGASCRHLPSHSMDTVGWILGWASAFIYLNSRIPQIVKNFRRKSTGGLSVAMFVCAVCGNLTYALGVLIRARGWNDVYHALPFLVGSLGTVSLDFLIVGQVLRYGSKSSELSSPLLQDDSFTEPCITPEPKSVAAMHQPVEKIGNVKPVYMTPSPAMSGQSNNHPLN
eukprot:c52475_g1_i1.p1 GENE.c52475_g1_i1~~c52475_g1_i1.p1  ORF type:complete len:322 (+),score=52.21 c52475_g1_i1:50-1015(+)